MKRRDLLIGAVALVGSAAAAGVGVAIGLPTLAPTLVPVPPPIETRARAAEASPIAHAPAVDSHGSPVVAPASTERALPHWGYDGATGPQAWGELDPASMVCKQGGSQSPIDLPEGLRVPALPGLQLSYGQTKVKIVNNGHTFQVNTDKGSTLTLDGKRFDLLQFHFHTPSEHTVDGRSMPLEMHLVHQAADKNLAVIAVLMSDGAPNMVLTKFWERLPKTEGEAETGQTIDLKDLLPRNVDDYMTYSGSLTTPPCTESVRWIVLKRSVEVSKAQIAAFRAVFPMNARPTQPIGARIILSS